MAGDAPVLHTHPMSRGRIARWMLEELGVPYEVRIHAFEALADAGYRALNPMAKVPALEHRGQVVTETAAICAYLADAFPDAGLAPGLQDPLRGPWLRWLFFAAGPVEAAVTAKALGLLPPEDKAGFVGYGHFERMLSVLEQAAADASPWLLGERFSAADVYLGGQVDFGLRFGTLPERAALVDFAARLRERPAYRRAAALDDALMAPQDG